MSTNSDFNLENPIYFAPDTLEWEEMEVNFLLWLLKGNLDEFYSFYYSKTSDIKLAEIDFDKAINFFPPPFTKEFQEGMPSKKIIPAEELYSLHTDGSVLNEY